MYRGNALNAGLRFVGVALKPDFTLSATPTSVSVNHGRAANAAYKRDYLARNPEQYARHRALTDAWTSRNLDRKREQSMSYFRIL